MMKFFTKKLKNEKGFTLVELLLVIVVMGIIAGIAAPRVMQNTNAIKTKADEKAAEMVVSKVESMILLGEIDGTTDWEIVPSGENSKYNEVLPKAQSNSNNIMKAYTKTGSSGIDVIVTDGTAAATGTTTSSAFVLSHGNATAISY